MTNFFHQGPMIRNGPLYWCQIVLTIILLVLFNTANGSIARENYDADYYSNVSLPCNFTLHNLTYPGIPVPFLRYWILPNASVIASNTALDPRMKIISTDQYTFNLFIASINEQDYGVYHCFMIWNNINYRSSAIRIGLNEDGPYYKQKLEEFERNVLIGCIAAGCVVLIIIIGCIVCRCRRMKNKSRGEMSDLDYYSTPTNEHQINTAATTDETPSVQKQQSIEELYAKVNQNRMAPTPTTGTVAEHSEHL